MYYSEHINNTKANNKNKNNIFLNSSKNLNNNNINKLCPKKIRVKNKQKIIILIASITTVPEKNYNNFILIHFEKEIINTKRSRVIII